MARITLAISRVFPKPGTSGPVIMVVTELMITNMVKMRCENAHVVADIKGDEFHPSEGVHQSAELKRLSPFHSGKTSCQNASTEFSRSGYRDN